MRIKCEIDGVKTLRKGNLKIILDVAPDRAREALKDIHNFMDRPITAEILIDAVIQRQRLCQITDEQRKKIFALLRDIALHIAGTDDPDEVKATLIYEFGRGDFSLSNCGKELAAEFIEYLIDFALAGGIQLAEHPMEYIEDTDQYVRMSLHNKICAICGKPGEVHHWDAVGMGRDRKTVDDSKSRKVCLCREHHTEAHAVGRDTFAAKYHLEGVEYAGDVD